MTLELSSEIKNEDGRFMQLVQDRIQWRCWIMAALKYRFLLPKLYLPRQQYHVHVYLHNPYVRLCIYRLISFSLS
jgi:hypothetical protein